MLGEDLLPAALTTTLKTHNPPDSLSKLSPPDNLHNIGDIHIANMAPKKRRESSPSAPSTNKKARTTTSTTNNAADEGAPTTGTAPPPPAPAVAPAATAATSTMPDNVALGAEDDPVVRTFGNLLEGSQHPFEEGNTEQRDTLVQRYRARRDLADMSARPEGYEFTLRLYGHDPQAVALLSPPHLAAIRDANGRWRRITRVPALHGQQPYTTQWYNQYLRDSNLPSWFFSGSHMEMMDLPQEAEDLGIAHDATEPRTSEHYLEVRYPHTPQVPDAGDHGRQGAFLYQLSEEEQLRLARMFPATNFLGNDRRVIVWPSGRITVHHDPSSLGLPQIVSELVGWIDSAVHASYVLEPRANNGSASTSIPPRNDLRRLETIENARANRAVLNPRGPCHGDGTFEYLTEIDEINAQILEFNDAHHAAQCIANGALRRGLQPGTSPVLVRWSPNTVNGYLNPPVQPPGDGEWYYLSPESQNLATINFGDQAWAAPHLAGNHNPTAEDIWRVRLHHNRLVALGGDPLADPTGSVDIVWVPDAPTTTNNGGVTVLSDDEFDDLDPVDGVEVDRGFGIDPVTGLAHWPPNDGTPAHDQTAHDDRGQYQTRMVGKKNFIKKITLDVARARPTVDTHGEANGNVPQPHRTWIYLKGGRWERWKGSHELDAPGGWEDIKLVEKLNRWAEQTRIRQDWRQKRPDSRERYTSEQKKWVWELVRDKKESYRTIAKAFNKAFGLKGTLQRDESGINSLVSRLKADEAKWAAGVKVRWKDETKEKTKDAEGGKEDDEGGKAEQETSGDGTADTEQAEQGGENEDGGDGSGQQQGHEPGESPDVELDE
ncbi:hypothetical protein CLAFUW4_03691 [Fulvia fulva]|uniref:Uncharacterized protein n=1 Tax=Passalora fulva TaxID=5499 RepID=A0A9Q8L942_PASFU|nr:uncharacterized protein CLAFUR5_03669 [Fulvia fulva]KAK4631320.1 hypothetical protein CLAFUR4_03679 [Fulvia fulva]KAK4633133.1 hypothetical protein CLAFUR0_03682 [Fulvia fulva]UJO13206.1 hypothetical protein CLAFUR5_03669 [Fulvia fulva]WPV11598.1 hypothetical protein CLAFUW4_03691 [Fulvia fulva]WPV26066.1 hypothetical protein CLAFUW7_03683 [Fulvia fulva]